ncbi:MAG: hypothetical protein ABR525_09545 [Candidatus Limnocylindria bacterium]
MAKTFALVFGAVYLLVDVAQQIVKDRITARHDPMADNVLHLVTGALALYIGFGTRAELARA